MTGKLLTLPEVADITRLALTTIRRWAWEGRLPVVRLGRRVLVRGSDLERWIAQGADAAEEAHP